MSIEEDIKQKTFTNPFNKALVNIIYTNSWIAQQHFILFKDHDLTIPQFNVLRILRGQYPNPSTVNLIIERMLDKSSNASRIVDKLVAKGHVDRKQCPSDRRAVDVFISKSGLDLLARLDVEMGKWETEMANLTDEECHKLSELLDKMRAKSTVPADTQ